MSHLTYFKAHEFLAAHKQHNVEYFILHLQLDPFLTTPPITLHAPPTPALAPQFSYSTYPCAINMWVVPGYIHPSPSIPLFSIVPIILGLSVFLIVHQVPGLYHPTTSMPPRYHALALVICERSQLL